MNDLRKILKYLSPYKKESFFATVLLALVVIADRLIPMFVQIIIDEGVQYFLVKPHEDSKQT
jgi:ABC-type multidrug transport system fused ATPase/permease subunit